MLIIADTGALISLGHINKIGSIGVLVEAKNRGMIEQLKPLFEKWLDLERYFSIDLLNHVLDDLDEENIR